MTAEIPKPMKIHPSVLVYNPKTGRYDAFNTRNYFRIPSNGGEFTARHVETSVPNGAQTITITPDRGKEWAVVEVGIWFAGSPGVGAYFDVHRTNGDPLPTNRLGGVYYGASNVLMFDNPIFSQEKIKIVVDHDEGAGATDDVYIYVKYYYR